MSPTLFLTLFAALYALHLVVETVLDVLNLQHIAKHPGVPLYIADMVTEETYKRSVAYTIAKTKTGVVRRAFSAVFTWALILSGAFGAIDLWLGSRLAYPLAIGMMLYVVQIPFALYNQFWLEQRFGFNRSSVATFVLDQVKGLALALVFGIPLLLLIYWFMDTAGTSWWIFAFLAWMGFQLLTAAIFPVFLAPLFYKFTLLHDSSLRDRIMALAQKIQFKMADVFSIDGSRRSAHSNAFFAGFGKTRRVVLFDTLMLSLSEDEIIAVIAHEMGHDKKRHIQRQLILSTLGSLFAFYVLSHAIQWPTLYDAFSAGVAKNYIGLVLFALFAGVVTFPLQPLFQLMSRRYEYEADRFSIETTGDKESMQGALKKLAKDNLSNLTPHPWYSFFHYSHPTLKERLDAIAK
jgi:STE24 endopeptidase